MGEHGLCVGACVSLQLSHVADSKACKAGGGRAAGGMTAVHGRTDGADGLHMSTVRYGGAG